MIKNFSRAIAPGVSAPLAFPMLPKPPLKISGYPCVERLIFAFEDVDVIWHSCKYFGGEGFSHSYTIISNNEKNGIPLLLLLYNYEQRENPHKQIKSFAGEGIEPS